MTSIGMRFASHGVAKPNLEPNIEPNIEDTLLAASEEGLEHDDLRTLAVLVTWLDVHARMIHADRLVRLVEEAGSPRVRAFWSAFAAWRRKDRRFARLEKLYEGPRLDLLSVGTDFHLRRHGEDPRFEGSALRVPANVLRDRASDVLTPGELARQHLGYRYRLMMGPGYRGDMWAAFSREPGLSAADLARRTHGSFATAWQVKRDWEALHAATDLGQAAR